MQQPQLMTTSSLSSLLPPTPKTCHVIFNFRMKKKSGISQQGGAPGQDTKQEDEDDEKPLNFAETDSSR